MSIRGQGSGSSDGGRLGKVLREAIASPNVFFCSEVMLHKLYITNEALPINYGQPPAWKILQIKKIHSE